MSSSILESISWLGHDTFRIDGSQTIYIDPFRIDSGKTADLILVTHEHYDHCSPEDIEKIQGKNTLIVTESLSAKKLKGNVKIVKPGDKIEVSGITIEAVPAYNTNKKFHPKANGWLGFIIEINGERIYHAGDTDLIPEMKNFKVDIALLPVSGTYVMTAEEAVEAALAIKPKTAIPMHYDSIVGSQENALAFQEALAGKVEVRVLKKV